ncbi:MAG: HD domain-containing protein [Bdellovibrionota bacterium]
MGWSDNEKREFENTTSNACLIHDIGHPPFGHAGEEVIQKTLTHGTESFEGNKQNIRIIFGLGIDEKIIKLTGL